MASIYTFHSACASRRGTKKYWRASDRMAELRATYKGVYGTMTAERVKNLIETARVGIPECAKLSDEEFEVMLKSYYFSIFPSDEAAWRA